jgi:hypothetical protein
MENDTMSDDNMPEDLANDLKHLKAEIDKACSGLDRSILRIALQEKLDEVERDEKAFHARIRERRAQGMGHIAAIIAEKPNKMN